MESRFSFVRSLINIKCFVRRSLDQLLCDCLLQNVKMVSYGLLFEGVPAMLIQPTFPVTFAPADLVTTTQHQAIVHTFPPSTSQWGLRRRIEHYTNFTSPIACLQHSRHAKFAQARLVQPALPISLGSSVSTIHHLICLPRQYYRPWPFAHWRCTVQIYCVDHRSSVQRNDNYQWFQKTRQ